MLCSVMQVSRSAYYQWLQPNEEKQSKRLMEVQIINLFKEHKRRYGVRRLSAELKDKGIAVGKYKCRSVLKKHGLKAIQPRSFVPRTTQSRHPYPISPNLLLDRELPVKPNEVWVGDITYIPLAEGRWAYLSVWMDLYSRKIVGWHLADHMREELVITALKMAIQSRLVAAGLILHSDRAGQYAAAGFRKLLQKPKIQQSMSRADDPYDNAFMESYFSRFKAELLESGVFENLQDAQTEIFEYIEMYYNSKRRHSALNYQSPMHYEKQYFYSLT
jgi:transposase InsO family protein